MINLDLANKILNIKDEILKLEDEVDSIEFQLAENLSWKAKAEMARKKKCRTINRLQKEIGDIQNLNNEDVV